MGGIKKAFKKITNVITKPIRSIVDGSWGGGGKQTVVYQQEEAPAAQAAPAADAAESSMNDQAYNAAKKRKKGKGSLYVSLGDGGTSGGTGINV